MNKPTNYQLTKNFSLYEYMEGQAMPTNAIKLAWMYFTPELEAKIKAFMPELQSIRDWANAEFKFENNGKEIGIAITAGYRPKEWELMQGRSGNSQHTICAVDFRFINCPKPLADDILQAVYDKYNKTWKGGLAIKQGSFIHLDPLPGGRRWKY